MFRNRNAGRLLALLVIALVGLLVYECGTSDYNTAPPKKMGETIKAPAPLPMIVEVQPSLEFAPLKMNEKTLREAFEEPKKKEEISSVMLVSLQKDFGNEAFWKPESENDGEEFTASELQAIQEVVDSYGVGYLQFQSVKFSPVERHKLVGVPSAARQNGLRQTGAQSNRWGDFGCRLPGFVLSQGVGRIPFSTAGGYIAGAAASLWGDAFYTNCTEHREMGNGEAWASLIGNVPFMPAPVAREIARNLWKNIDLCKQKAYRDYPGWTPDRVIPKEALMAWYDEKYCNAPRDHRYDILRRTSGYW